MWTAAALCEEIGAAEALLKARDNDAKLATSLLHTLVVKVESLKSPSPQELVTLYEKVQASLLPSSMQDKLVEALDACATGQEGATKLQVTQQQLEHPQNYLTKSDWDALLEGSMMQGVPVICQRLRAIGVVSLKESTKKMSTALLVCSELERTGKLPGYHLIYEISQMLADTMATLKMPVPAGVPMLCNYPAHPSQLGNAVLKAAYPDEGPCPKEIAQMHMVAQKHTPVRNTHALLRKPSSQDALARTPSSEALGMQSQGGQQQSFMQAMQDWMAKSSAILDSLKDGQGTHQPCQPHALNPRILGLPRGMSSHTLGQAPQAALPLANGDQAPGQQHAEAKDDGQQQANSKQKTLEDFEQAAFEQLERKAKGKQAASKSKPKAKGPATKAAPKKAVGKAKATAKSSMKKPAASKSTQVSGASLVLGCKKCRGSPSGCKQCLSPSYSGTRFGSHAARKHWADLHGKKWFCKVAVIAWHKVVTVCFISKL